MIYNPIPTINYYMKSHFVILLIAASSYFVGGSRLQAAMYTISGTGLFDQSLGELTSVDILIEPPETTLSEAGSHSHTWDPTSYIPTTFTGDTYADGTTIDFLPILLSFPGGTHTNSVSVSSFSSSMGTINFPVATTFGSHNHSVDFASTTVGASVSGRLDLPITATNTTGLHSHALTIPSFSQSFSGSQLEPFLSGTPNATIDPPSTISSNEGIHQHFLSFSFAYSAVINGGSTETVRLNTDVGTSISGGHAHTMDIEAFDVTNTTFHYTPVPEPSSAFLLGLGGLALAIRRSRR